MVAKRDRRPDILQFIELAHAVRRDLGDCTRQVMGLTLEQTDALWELESAGGRTTVSQLARALDRTSHSMTSRVDGLEARGLIVRERKRSGDRRLVWVRLTRKGSGALAGCRSALAGLFELPQADGLVCDLQNGLQTQYCRYLQAVMALVESRRT